MENSEANVLNFKGSRPLFRTVLLPAGENVNSTDQFIVCVHNQCIHLCCCCECVSYLGAILEHSHTTLCT